VRSFTTIQVGYGLIVFFLTYLLSQFYIGGDQAHYSEAYSEVSKHGLKEAFLIYIDLLNATDFIHFILIWSAGEYFDKDIIMSISNAVLAYLATAIMLKRGANKIIVLIVLLGSFYPMVLFLSAERLKFAIMFFFLAILLYDSGWKKIGIIAAYISVFSHLQILISYASILFPKLIDFFKDGLIKKSLIYTSILFILTLGLMLFLMQDQIMYKARYYIHWAPLLDVFKMLILMTITLFYAQNKKWFVASLFVPLIFFVTILGAERVVFYGYFIFLYFALQVSGGYNLGVIGSILYGLNKTILFFASIFKFGDGFQCVSYTACFI
jgi:hypothetical protein